MAPKHRRKNRHKNRHKMFRVLFGAFKTGNTNTTQKPTQQPTQQWRRKKMKASPLTSLVFFRDTVSVSVFVTLSRVGFRDGVRVRFP